jgi:hypothetical protein
MWRRWREIMRWFKFKHPLPPNDIKRAAERVSVQSGLVFDSWTQTTNTIDYGIYGKKMQIKPRLLERVIWEYLYLLIC